MVDPIDEALPDEKRKEIFYFFLKDFLSHMKNVSANIKSVSQAIRSYGYFAAVRVKIIYGIPAVLALLLADWMDFESFCAWLDMLC